MGKPKFLEDADAQDYKMRLAEFMAQVNPKPTLAQVEELRQSYLAKRECHETNKPTA